MTSSVTAKHHLTLRRLVVRVPAVLLCTQPASVEVRSRHPLRFSAAERQDQRRVAVEHVLEAAETELHLRSRRGPHDAVLVDREAELEHRSDERALVNGRAVRPVPAIAVCLLLRELFASIRRVLPHSVGVPFVVLRGPIDEGGHCARRCRLSKHHRSISGLNLSLDEREDKFARVHRVAVRGYGVPPQLVDELLARELEPEALLQDGNSDRRNGVLSVSLDRQRG
mmetsp:Transcript_16793/g.54916  ORF Transcript_16793/g.54916 Transcript_16793/m.54916 type:complete len:226 (+) Transcript_16793:1615-2292(+)